MDTTMLIILGILIGYLVISVTISNIKKSAFQKGYKTAEFDITAKMLDRATWFGGTSKIIYNVLYLFAIRYRKKGHVDAHFFREDILKLDHTKRITDLPEEEYKRLFE